MSLKAGPIHPQIILLPFLTVSNKQGSRGDAYNVKYVNSKCKNGEGSDMKQKS